MSTWRLAILTVALAWSAAAGGSAPTAGPAAPGAATVAPPASVPKIRFAAPVFDFGTVAAGTVVNHDYVFTNAGASPLVVTGVLPSCDCTTVGEWSAVVGAGQTGRIPIRFASAGYGGPIDKWIMVASNDPDQPQVKLGLAGVVRKPIDVSPPNAVFTPVAGSPAGESTVIRITNHTGEPLVLSAPASRSRAFVVELRTVRPGQEFELHVTAVPPFGAGTVSGLVTVKTNSSQVPVIAVTALVAARPPAAAAAKRQEHLPSPKTP